MLRPLLAPSPDREERNSRGFEHALTMKGLPSRPRDGPKVGDQRPEAFGRLDAELEHQQLPVSGELPERLGGVALCDVHPDERGLGLSLSGSARTAASAAAAASP
jgi:hypothetical protein